MTPQLAYDKIKEALESLAKLDNEPYYGTSVGNEIAKHCLALLPELMPVKVGENACPDCGAEMIEVCSGLEKEVRRKRAGECIHKEISPAQEDDVERVARRMYETGCLMSLTGDQAKKLATIAIAAMNRAAPTCEEIIALLEPIAEQDWHGKWRIRKAIEIMRSVKPAPTCDEICKEINKFKYKNVTDATVSFNLAIDLCEDGICNLFERAGK